MLQDRFRHAGPKDYKFVKAGSSNWPYLEFDILSLRSRHEIQTSRNVVVLLEKMLHLKTPLNDFNLGQKDGFLAKNTAEWADRKEIPAAFWDCCIPELQLQLSEHVTGFSNGNTGFKPYSRMVDDQLIC